MTPEELIATWDGKPGGQERSNFAAFIPHLCDVLGVPTPGPIAKGEIGAYGYEASVPHGSFRSLKGSGSIDLYKRGHFIMEAKQSYLPPDGDSLALEPDAAAPRAPSGARYDRLMREARLQAENYAKNLPAGEPVAPFLIVCDVGRAFELYVDTAGNGRGYRFFPDRQHYRIELKQLASDAKVGTTGKTALELLHAIWTAPRSVDPRHLSADVTRTVAANLASVSKYLEEGITIRTAPGRERQEEIEEASLFLMRVLFCMFAEDIGLLPENSFKAFLQRAEKNDKLFQHGLADLFQKMNSADPGNRFAHAVEAEVRHFNGRLFQNNRTYPLGGFVIHDLYEAARQNWRRVEPAIFGTLLEQALDPAERAKLGAHYTPRPYVELLVRATVMDVLEPEWEAVEEEIEQLLSNPPRNGEGYHVQHGGGAGAASLNGEGASNRGVPLHHLSGGPPPHAGEELRLATAFHTRLAATRVLDPACGTGNFLYVAMELMQELEARVIERIATLGGRAEPKVGPHQFHGLELNPRAAKIAELVLWIGWLRNRLQSDPDNVPEPVLAESASINFGRPGGYDAVLRRGEWGEVDADSAAQPAWPEAEFIVGNPPFIGGKDLRDKLGGDYAEALWAANERVPKSADFVMQWWDRAAHILTAEGSALQRFGFVTTNSITQEFSRRVIAGYLAEQPSPLAGEGGGAAAPEGEGQANPPRNGEGDHVQHGGGAGAASLNGEGAPRGGVPLHHPAGGPPPPAGEDTTGLTLLLAIPDHPWTRATKDAAAVRIAMTVAGRGAGEGVLREVTGEARLDTDAPEVTLSSTTGRINANLTMGASAGEAKPLLANEGLSSRGMMLFGAGFIVPFEKLEDLGFKKRAGADLVLRPYLNGRDLLQKSRSAWVIDTYGLNEKDLRIQFPEIYEHLLRTVKPERDRNRDKGIRENWWIFGRPRSEIRPALKGLCRYIGTAEIAKHRVFEFLSGSVVPDNRIVIIADERTETLGILQSTIHTEWSLKAGGTLEDRPTYSKSKVFDPFPFPNPTPDQRAIIADLAEELDATRKAALAEVERLTMTELYNLRDRLRAHASGGEPLSDKDARRASQARAGIVNRLHEQLDAAVADAYGWGAEWAAGALGSAEIVARLVALNAERAAEEAAGHVRWLRPEYQKPRFGAK